MSDLKEVEEQQGINSPNRGKQKTERYYNPAKSSGLQDWTEPQLMEYSCKTLITTISSFQISEHYANINDSGTLGL
jgi:hypothetical protein